MTATSSSSTSRATASALALARSFLFVPANRPDRYAKALATGAGAVIIDLEDAVAAADKSVARDQLAMGFAALPATDRKRLLVRINASGTAWHGDDLKLLRDLTAAGLAGVVLPKAESAGQVRTLAAYTGEAVLLPMLESAASLDALADIAAAPQVLRLVFGNIDFQADLGMACGGDEAELQPVRFALVLASRRAGIAPPVDGVTVATGDATRVHEDALRGRRSGFGAKLCIHPSQLAQVQRAFAPTDAELAWAQRVVDGSRQSGGAVFTLDGKMVDAPVLRLAGHTLAMAGPGGAAAG
ncbi:MAG: CoA ester lyase [Polaromonas sp.]|nr:CoA ester lyase [Polaromonas sp.]